MQLRVAGPSCRRGPAGLTGIRRHACVALAAVAAVGAWVAACREAARPPDDLRIEWRLTPAPATVGPSTIRLTLLDASGRPVPDARLRLEGQMTHPGMAPAIADVHERASGEYEAAMTFSMAGDWVLLLDGELADGRRVRREMRVSIAGSRR